MIYLDHAATTPICKAAKETIMQHLNDFGNPSSSHELGRQARILIEDARERIAKCINAEPDEIYFTSGGSEANTWALLYRSYLSSGFEHHSIRPTFTFPVNSSGVTSLRDFSKTVYAWYDPSCPKIASCMMVNNELGTIQPIKELARIAHDRYMLFHTDAVQAIGHIPVNIKDLDCDILSASGHKFGSVKGTGFLFVKNGVKLNRLINGGKQEQGKRPGTENVLGVISMAAALEDTVKHMEERNAWVKYLRDKLLNKLLQIPGSHLNGSLENRVCSNINIRFDGISGSRLVTLCSLYGIYISSGSACNEGIATPSHVLKAIGLTDEEALSSVRITLGHENTEEEIDQAADIITQLVERIRDEE
jgi:cysteine desulfurase